MLTQTVMDMFRDAISARSKDGEPVGIAEIRAESEVVGVGQLKLFMDKRTTMVGVKYAS